MRGWHQVLTIVLLVSRLISPRDKHVSASTTSFHPAKSSLDSVTLCTASTLHVPRMRCYPGFCGH